MKITILVWITLFMFGIHLVAGNGVSLVLNKLARPSVHISWPSPADNYTLYINKTKSMHNTNPKVEEKIYFYRNVSYLHDLEFSAVYSFTKTSTTDGIESLRSAPYVITTPDAPRPVTKSSTVIEVLILPVPNSKYHELIVTKLFPGADKPTPSMLKNLPMVPEDEQVSKDAYITYVTTMNRTVEVGNGSLYTYRNKNYKNIPLLPGMKYAFLQRTYLLDGTNFTHKWSEDVFTDKVEKFDETEIAVLTGGIAISLIVIVFFIIIFCHWHYTCKYSPKPPKKIRNELVERLNTDPSLPVTDTYFPDHMTQMKFNNFKGFNDEFSRMPNKVGQHSEFSQLPSDQKKRYNNVPCYDLSRVKNKGNEQVYLHANYVPGFETDKDYIIMLGPHAEEIVDFWRMVMENDIEHIVLIGRMDKSSKQQACCQYFPLDEKRLVMDNLEVMSIKLSESADMVKRKITVSMDDETVVVQHYQFYSWPSVQVVPPLQSLFLQFVLRIYKDSLKDEQRSPILVHSAAYNGSPSIYACIDSQIRRLIEQNDVNIHNKVLEVRDHRHDGIKSLDEFIFIHDCLMEFILTRNFNEVPIQYLPSYVDNVNKEGGPRFGVEFDFIVKNLSNTNHKSLVANLACNKNKNTYEHIKPFDYNRVKLKKLHNSDGSDYINASYLDTYMHKQAYIVSQTPNVEAMETFWRMVYEMKGWVIVMFGQEVEEGELRSESFWPEEGFVMVLGDFTVSFISETYENERSIVLRQIQLSNDKLGEKKMIVFYQYLHWPCGDNISSQSLSSLMTIIQQSDNWKEKLQADKIILVSCCGSGRPGVVVALKSILEEAKATGSANIFRTVYTLRQQRTAMVQTRKDYCIIYSCSLLLTKNVRKSSIMSMVGGGTELKYGVNQLPSIYKNLPTQKYSMSYVSLNSGEQSLLRSPGTIPEERGSTNSGDHIKTLEDLHKTFSSPAALHHSSTPSVQFSHKSTPSSRDVHPLDHGEVNLAFESFDSIARDLDPKM